MTILESTTKIFGANAEITLLRNSVVECIFEDARCTIHREGDEFVMMCNCPATRDDLWEITDGKRSQNEIGWWELRGQVSKFIAAASKR